MSDSMELPSTPDGPQALASLTSLYARSAGIAYAAGTAGVDLALDPIAVADGGGRLTSVGFLAHALQTAAQAAAARPDDEELHAAALLHDVGWLLPKPSERALLTSSASTAPLPPPAAADAAVADADAVAAAVAAEADAVFIARHDVTGAAHLGALGFPPRVCRLVGGHVQAKRYLVATDAAYAARLSPGSAATLRHQGGPMTAQEAAAFEADADHALVCDLRRWDEGAKVVGAVVPAWDAWLPTLARVLARARFAPFAALEGSPRALSAVLPPAAAATALGPAGPGFAVVRGWLSADELRAVRRYASEAVPAMDGGAAAGDAAVFHTFERTRLAGDIAKSRTEHFAHVADADCVGARFLREGRLRELCSALREGRAMALYKEKVNYKARGGGGGYLPHQDYYHGFSAADGSKLSLLPDEDVCVCMVAVDDMDEENGCPEVAPGWHTRGPLAFRGSVPWDHEYKAADGSRPPEVDPADMPWTPVRLRAGDVLIYGNLMPHRSAENNSTRDRRALFAVFSDAARHGEGIRELYYASERRGRRAAGSAREGGKANLFFTGEAVHVAV